MIRRTTTLVNGVAAALVLTTAMAAAPDAHGEEVAHAAGFTATQKWSDTLNDPGNPIALSSPNVAELDGQPSVVVGDRQGWVYALHVANGSYVSGWPYNAGAPVDSSPSVAPINIFGLDTVYVGSGNAGSPASGGYQAISPGGGDQWFVQETNPPGDPVAHNGVAASLTVGSYAYGYGVEAGSLGQNTDALGAGNGAMLGGFPWFQGDSVFSTAAVADLYSDGNSEIVSGGDSSAGLAYGQNYANGGHIRILSTAGNVERPPRPAASSANTTPTRTSTGRRRRSGSSWAAAAWASPSATGATTPAHRTPTRSSP